MSTFTRTVLEAAEEKGCSPGVIYYHCRTKRLRCKKSGGRVLVVVDEKYQSFKGKEITQPEQNTEGQTHKKSLEERLDSLEKKIDELGVRLTNGLSTMEALFEQVDWILEQINWEL